MMRSIEWRGNGVRFIDQTKLPLEECYIETGDFRVVADAIRKLKIRGAPAIGIAAAYAVSLAALSSSAGDLKSLSGDIERAIDELSSTRPTAVNLFWALRRMKEVLRASTSVDQARAALLHEATEIHRQDEEMCRCIGMHGASLILDVLSILTHCNTCAL